MGVKLFKIPGGCVGLLVWCFFVATGQAGTWELLNGDRLTGDLVTENAQFIEVQHPQLGRLKVPRAALRSPGETAPKSIASKTVAVQTATAEAKPAPKPDENHLWKRQIEIGYSQQSGAKDKQDLALRGQIEGREGANTFRATGRLLQSEADGKKVTDRREGDFRWRYDINKRLFAQALTNYAEDDVRKIDLSLEQQLGGGYRIVDTPRHKINVGLGAVVQYLQREAAPEQTSLLGTLFQDYAYQLNTRFKLIQESSVLASKTGALGVRSGVGTLGPEGSYRVKFNAGVQSKVTDHMSLNMRFEYDYDRSIIEPGLRADQRLTTALGFLW